MPRSFKSLVNLLLSCVVTLLLLPSVAVRADDWPQWRGLNRDGVWDESGLLKSFPPEGLKVRWRVPVGWGFSSPVVAQERVYLADSELMKPNAKERLRCWDETTGKPLWNYSYEVAYEDWAFDPTQEIGPVATPIVQNGKIYSQGRLGDLCCLDAATGDVLWKRNLNTDFQAAFAPGAPSPLIEGDLLILFIGGKSGACVVALDKDTGREVWRALDESLTYSSPIVVPAGGKRQLIVWTQESVTSLDPAAGTTYWRQRLLTSGDYAVSTPVFFRDRLLIGGLMFQLDPEQPAATVLWPASKAPARRILSHTSTALFRSEYLFSAKSSGELICVDASTGEHVWETDKVTDLKNGASIHLTPNGDSVLLYTDRGELIRAQLNSQGYKELSRVAVLEPTVPFGGRKVTWSPPAYANRHIFARNGKELICASLAAATAEERHGSPIERYRKLEFPPTEENFDKGWQDRVALEYEIINAADLADLRRALKDKNAFVRCMAARALGIRADKDSADALAELVRADPEYTVRIRAVEALAYLKMKPEAVELATKDRQLGVQWVAKIVAGQLASDTDYAAEVRQAFAAGIQRERMGVAKVGERAPDFTAQTLDGKPFKLSEVIGEQSIAIYFAAFDG